MRTTTSPRPGSGSARSTNPNFRGALRTAARLLIVIDHIGGGAAPPPIPPRFARRATTADPARLITSEGARRPLRYLPVSRGGRPPPIPPCALHHDGDFFDWEVRNDLGAVGVDDQHLLDGH